VGILDRLLGRKPPGFDYLVEIEKQRQARIAAYVPPATRYAVPFEPASIQGDTFMASACENIVSVVGESFQQPSLGRVSGGRTAIGPREPMQIAQLVPEPANPVDPKAVQVLIKGVPVGHLSRAKAVAYRPAIDRLAVRGLHLGCHALLTGGWSGGPDGSGTIGVVLHLAKPKLLIVEIDGLLGSGE